MNNSPIVLFCYNRPEHLRRTVEALQKNELAAESELIIYSDGVKEVHSSQLIAHSSQLTANSTSNPVKMVREYIRTIDGFKSVKIIESPVNKGLANSIIDGVTEVVNKYGKVIVLEDDLVTSPFFFFFLNTGLCKYSGRKDIAGVYGFCYPLKWKAPEIYVLCFTDSWGWGTWKEQWEGFNGMDALTMAKEIKSRGLIREFDFDGAYPFYETLEKVSEGAIDAWAIRWYASVFLYGKYGIFPGKTLIQHIGWDSGTHFSAGDDVFVSPLAEQEVSWVNEPELIERTFCKAFYEFNHPDLRPAGISQAAKFLVGAIKRRLYRKK